MYSQTLAGLGACYVAGLPFYRNDLAATSIVLGVALGVPALVRRLNEGRAQEALIGK
jgi:NO-binding membrane sensor protein with MHYT domain